MIQHVGNLFSAGISNDGVNYQLVPGTTVDLEMPTTVKHGIIVASAASNILGSASFPDTAIGSSVTTTMVPAAPPAIRVPGALVLHRHRQSGTHRRRHEVGCFDLVAGTGTTGFGDITDSAHFVYQPATSDQTISAQVATASGRPRKPKNEDMVPRRVPCRRQRCTACRCNPSGSATIRWRVNDGVKTSTNIPYRSTASSPAYLAIARSRYSLQPCDHVLLDADVS